MDEGGTTHRQLLKHASPSFVLPSSQSSPVSVVPFPQTEDGEEDEEEDDDEEDKELLEEPLVQIPEEQISPRGHTFVPSHGTQRPFTHTWPLVQRLPIHCADELDELEDDEEGGPLDEDEEDVVELEELVEEEEEDEEFEEELLTEEELKEVLLDELVLDVETHVPLPLH